MFLSLMNERTQPSNTGLKTRKLALEGLKAILIQQKTLDQCFLGLFDKHKSLEPRDKAFVRSLIYDVLRYKGYLDFFLKRLMRQPLKVEARDAEIILHIALCQIYCMETPDHAAIDTAVTLIKNHKNPKVNHLSGLANGVLRNSVRQRPKLWREAKRDPLRLLPRWLINRWEKQWGLKTARSMARALAFRPKLDLTVKQSEANRNWAKELNGTTLLPQHVRLEAGTDVTSIAGYDKGQWWVQDLAASLPASLFDDLSGKQVLDVCAAPGGKTMQLADQGAEVTSLDISEHRLKKVSENLDRTNLGAKVKIVAADILDYKADTHFDAILVDAPCSATGTLRRHPDGLWIKSSQTIKDLTDLQQQVLDHCWAMLKSGGEMVYCVCSLEKEEGENQITTFLERHEDASPKAINNKTQENLTKLGLDQWSFDKAALRTRPDMLADHGNLDGFFMIKLQKA